MTDDCDIPRAVPRRAKPTQTGDSGFKIIGQEVDMCRQFQ